VIISLFVGAMIVSIFINYALNINNPNWEEPIDYETKNETDSSTATN